MAAADEGQQRDFFEKRIRPLLIAECYECHTSRAKELGGGLSLEWRGAIATGGASGPAIVPGAAEKSLLVKAIRHDDAELRMPPEKKLSAEQIADLTAWVNDGAFDPRDTPPVGARAVKKYGVSLEEGRKFWSMQPVREPTLPDVQDRGWLQTPIDAFVLARLEKIGLKPEPAADRRTLLRRLAYDLTGLPPTIAEMEAFVADGSPHAFEAAMERYLASPRYGERWGRHWLDVVRYSDTCGNASDYPVPQAHKYRDWVVQAIAADKPYDQFLREQLAGDLIPGGTEAERHERIVATGYLAIARRFGGNRDGEFHLTLEDTIDNLGRGLLGSSIACARCHDHKFDPFTQNDYYGLYGIFSSTRYPFPGAEVGKRQEDFVPLLPPAEVEAIVNAHEQRVAAADAEVKRLEAEEAEINKQPDGEEKKAAQAALSPKLAETRNRRGQVQAEILPIERAYAVAEGKVANARLHVRGDPKRLGDEVSRHFPAVLGGQAVSADSASGRLELAEWIVDPANPLTARVMVNRIWQQHFGRGLVETPNDFGHQGKPPSHPELLDYLAAQFVKSGWSIKAMHRLILQSHTWQLASSVSPDGMRLDPNNELFGHFPRRRLSAEELRDTLLVVSGQLDETRPTPHPFPPENTWGWTQHNPFVAAYDSSKRSIYLMQQRLRKNPYLALFDGADPSSSTGVRLMSTTPLQALFLMNGPLAHSASSGLAERIRAASAAEGERIEFAHRLLFGRTAEAEEVAACGEFLETYRQRLTSLGTPAERIDAVAWEALARTLLSSNELAFVD
jgi:hypothetical protein